MAHVVKVEKGDILILANVGDDALGDLVPAARALDQWLGTGTVLLFAADFDLSTVPASQVFDGLAGA